MSHPTVMLGPAYWSISPVFDPATEDSVVPIGFEDDSAYLGGLISLLVNAAMAVPNSVRNAPDMNEWRRLTLSHLAEQRDLRLISIWHPSFIDLLLQDTTHDAQTLWPRLKVISCWADGHSADPVKRLRNRFPHAMVQPKGLIATESIISIPFARKWPLAIRSHFFEFIAADGSVRLADALVQGEKYEVVVTTSGGLYRYRLNDLIRVDGFVGKTPSIRFLGKASLVSDRFGEKLSQPFVTEALAALQSQFGVTWPFAMLAPEGNTYTLYVEGEVRDTLASLLDQALRQNPHYAYCRDLGQLQSPAIVPVGPHATAGYLNRLQYLGQRLGDIKPTCLSTLDNWKVHLVDEKRNPELHGVN